VLIAVAVLVTYRIIPGGPKLEQSTDLVVESIHYEGSEGTSSPCTGLHTASFNVTVTIRNNGAKTADLPFGKYWVVIWSVIGGTAAPFKEFVAAPPSQLAGGQSMSLTKKVSAMANVTPDKSKSALTFGVIVDPDKVIAESNEDNNFKDKETVYGGELCPPPQ
jgi:hypothetical protein